MASLHKITIVRYVLGTGKNVRYVPKGTPGARKVKAKSAKWYAVFTEGRKKKKVPLSPDKTTAQAMLADLLRNRERGRADLIDPHKQHKSRPVEDHVNDYLADLQVQAQTDYYRQNARNALNRLSRSCRFVVLADLDGAKLDSWLADLPRADRTKNWYREHAVAFGNWLVKKKRLPDNPFRHVTRASGQPVKRKRRALPVADLLHLLETARTRPLQDGMTIRRGPRKGRPEASLSDARREKLERLGHEHYLIYKTAVLSGLRWGELSRLEVGHLHLTGPAPYLHLPGVLPSGEHGTKNGKDAILPLKLQHADELRDWVAGRNATEKVFNFPDPSRSIAGLRRDLAAAAIPYQDDEGRYFDFHSLRVCTSSYLHAAKLHPRFIQLFMRHADPNLTTHYDDATLHDLRQAVNALPELRAREEFQKAIDREVDRRELEMEKKELLSEVEEVRRKIERSLTQLETFRQFHASNPEVFSTIFVDVLLEMRREGIDVTSL